MLELKEHPLYVPLSTYIEQNNAWEKAMKISGLPPKMRPATNQLWAYFITKHFDDITEFDNWSQVKWQMNTLALACIAAVEGAINSTQCIQEHEPHWVTNAENMFGSLGYQPEDFWPITGHFVMLGSGGKIGPADLFYDPYQFTG